ncbi:MAG TPA: NAD(P)-binding protein, partial [Acidimicrobiales bacterium]
MTDRSRYAGLPITDDDATIAAALEDVSIPTLLLSMIHMSGDADLLDGPLRPAGIYLNEVQGFMSPEDQAAVRVRALEVIRAYRDGGCVLPPPPDAETIRRMMSFLVAGEVPDEYVPMMVEELELDGHDARDLGWGDSIPDAAKQGFGVVVIGCGMSGLLAAIKLHEAGIPFTVIEKNAGPGGTWFENRYPGCRVDVGNHFYCYSFEPNNDWTEFFAQHAELQAYFESTMVAHGVAERIRFETEVISARWDDETRRWLVTVRSPEGELDTIDAAAVISAVGQLNRPKLPEIEGRDTFEGLAMHSARWPDDADLRAKRVAVIGTGASAFQIVPSVADEVEHLTVFQRSAPWMFPNPHYHDRVGAGVRWALRHLPYYGRWYRFLLFWPACDGGLPAMTVDPDWPHPERAVSAINDAAREYFTQYMTDQVGDDPELVAKVIPDYVCLGKRTLQDNGSWLGALTRDNVDLVTDPIAEIRADRLVGADGREYPVDVIVYATGFYANRYLWPMEITGRDGVVLSEQWGDEPTAYLGITVPNFPNLFCLYGPGTNLAHGGSLIFHSECQMRYVMGCLAAMLTTGHSTIECRREVHDAYNERLQDALDHMVWSHPS